METAVVRRRDLLLAAIATPLAGCLRGADVSISGPRSQPRFALRKAGLIRSRLDFPGSLGIRDAGGECVWEIRTESFGRLMDVSEIRFGQLPEGCAALCQPKPLRPETIYLVVVSGSGYAGGTHFAYVGDTLLVEQGSGDASHRLLCDRIAAAAG